MVKVFGASIWLPLGLNIVATGALALVVDLWSREFGLSKWWRAGLVLAVLAIGPVGPLAMTGMEHVAHAAVVLLLVYLALRRQQAGPVALGLVAAMATGFRYESAFVAAALALVLALRGDWRRSAALIAGPVLVVTGVGLAQMSVGEGFLPNSLVTKAAWVSVGSIKGWVLDKAFGAVEDAFQTPVAALPMLAVLGGWLAARADGGEQSRALSQMAVQSGAALVIATLIHIVLARTGWYHRYEAYLLIWGIVSVVASARAWQLSQPASEPSPSNGTDWTSVLGLAGVGLLLLLGLGFRVQAWTTAPEACVDIATQHRPMAQFVERYYNNAPLVAHDIGYTGYLSNCQILDIAGLASHSVSAARRQGTFDSQWVGEAAREIGARIAISYEKPILPEAWEKVACWDTGAVRVAGDDKMCFYAVAPGTRDQLLSNLREFEDQLPPRVSVEYFDQ